MVKRKLFEGDKLQALLDEDNTQTQQKILEGLIIDHRIIRDRPYAR